jgi:hypothetical protein
MNTQIARRPPPELGKRSQGQPEQRRGHQQGGAE